MRNLTRVLFCLLSVSALATPMKVGDAQKVGNLQLRLESAQLAPFLGQPSSQGKPVEEAATGLTVKAQTYAKHGVVVTLSREKKATVWRVERFTVKAPCAWKTPQGIGIGSSDQAVRKVYSQLLDSESQSNQQLVVGSIYDGVIFHLKNGKVESIFVGAAAE